MSDAKAEILKRIRTSLGDHPQPAEPVRNYRKVSDKSEEEVLEMLIDRLVDYKANVYQETEETIAERVSELLGKSSRYVVPTGLKSEWLPKDTAARTRLVDSGNAKKSGALGVRELDAVDAVVTSSTVSCAETGTIFLTSNPDEGRRAITLVPDHHICVVPIDTVVELIPEAIKRTNFDQPVTMISGPSATSDIELIRVEGVHGPRTLDVIILK
ncbi:MULTISPECIES: LUD domain-containing protein [unclassified Rothia (in: high G+C Gram-positive bacteria)]|uniref:LutC/YkgG family protein n=1 Tax=unclassified Rothia (in: high G+C Gram-positive bacteria) TaxID=2689056 RepID=UPI0019565531|nr:MULTISPECIES: LUD domain-containing protein [unclassified Rothia (in: high G+C Gram-positive bacteria)]MBM7051993.1 LUD domain-containing protein [Rothia sp. ZJ1223]QRZ61946.1 LUD domain-containing protein [Rothia sp. ZJ932]